MFIDTVQRLHVWTVSVLDVVSNRLTLNDPNQSYDTL